MIVIQILGLFNFPELKLLYDEVRQLRPDFLYTYRTLMRITLIQIPYVYLPRRRRFWSPIIKIILLQKGLVIWVSLNVLISDPVNGVALNGDDHCWIEPNGVYSDVDSLGVFKIDGKYVLNANDKPFSEHQCKSLYEKFGTVDLACLPYGFQGPYPAFYEKF